MAGVHICASVQGLSQGGVAPVRPLFWEEH